MTCLPDRFIEDRALRDAARAVLTEDIEQLRSSLSEQGIAARVSSGITSRISSRLKHGAHDVWTEAKLQAGDRKGVIAVLIGAIILWFSRGPIFEWIEELVDESSAHFENQSDDAPLSKNASQGDSE